jgi:hypothetical protein
MAGVHSLLFHQQLDQCSVCLSRSGEVEEFMFRHRSPFRNGNELITINPLMSTCREDIGDGITYNLNEEM